MICADKDKRKYAEKSRHSICIFIKKKKKTTGNQIFTKKTQVKT
jgi:hypothetical protein